MPAALLYAARLHVGVHSRAAAESDGVVDASVLLMPSLILV